MLVELSVHGLGVIEHAEVVLGPGLTAVTGETGAGKTLLVEAIELVTGARADPTLVHPAVTEAVVEARFEPARTGPAERVLRRVLGPTRSRAYVDGRMATAAELARVGAELVDLHGQHAHHALLSAAAQRDALDRGGGVDPVPLAAARRALRRALDAERRLGGDERARAREIDLLRFQLEEIDRAGISGPDEDDELRAEEERLADAAGRRLALQSAHHALAGDDGALDRIGAAVGALAGRAELEDAHRGLRALAAETADAAEELRREAEAAEEDPGRLAELGARRDLLRGLRRKYGATLAEVLDFRAEAASRLAELESHEQQAAAVAEQVRHLRAEEAAAAAAVGAARRAAAGRFASAVEGRLRELALPHARFVVDVGDDPAGERVTWALAANPGSPPLPLSRVASGGELSRTMLAVRLALGSGGDGSSGRTVVFDEVDAGVGGEAAVAVGRALAELAADHQVLVVTHLPQVAAFAHHQVVVTKTAKDAGTAATARPVEGEERVRELARMLSGRPDSATARRHAAELLADAAAASRPGRVRGRRRAAR
jgi:DNA repair protein RecN (Recombination protein N)